MIDDAELLRRYASGRSEDAFTELVGRHLGLVYSAALRRTANAQMAEETTQHVFIAVARNAAALSRHVAFVGWLYTTARFWANRICVAERRRRRRDQEAYAMEETPSSQESDWDRLRPGLDEAMEKLSDRDRAAVLLRFFEGRSFAEVGIALRLTEEAARKRAERGVERLRRSFAKRGITSTSAALTAILSSQAGLGAPAGLTATVAGAALAGSAETGALTGAFSLLNLMSSTKISAIAAGALALAAIGFGIHEHSRNLVDEAALNLAMMESDNLRAHLRSLEGRTVSQAQPATPNALPSKASQIQPAPWQSTNPVEFALNQPEARAAFIQKEVARAKAKFGRFFAATGLSSEQQELFLNKVQRYAEAQLDLTAAIQAQGFGPENPPQDPEAYLQLMKLDAQAGSDFASSIRGSFGDAVYDQFTAYRKALPVTNVTDQLAGQLYDTSTPLTSQQAGQLAQILTQNQYQAAATPSPTDTLNGTVISNQAYQGAMIQSNLANGDIMMPSLDWHAPITDAAIANAQSVLAPAQLAALRQVQEQQVAQLLLAPPPPPQPDISSLIRKKSP